MRAGRQFAEWLIGDNRQCPGFDTAVISCSGDIVTRAEAQCYQYPLPIQVSSQTIWDMCTYTGASVCGYNESIVPGNYARIVVRRVSTILPSNFFFSVFFLFCKKNIFHFSIFFPPFFHSRSTERSFYFFPVLPGGVRLPILDNEHFFWYFNCRFFIILLMNSFEIPEKLIKVIQIISGKLRGKKVFNNLQSLVKHFKDE